MGAELGAEPPLCLSDPSLWSFVIFLYILLGVCISCTPSSACTAVRGQLLGVHSLSL